MNITREIVRCQELFLLLLHIKIKCTGINYQSLEGLGRQNHTCEHADTNNPLVNKKEMPMIEKSYSSRRRNCSKPVKNIINAIYLHLPNGDSGNGDISGRR